MQPTTQAAPETEQIDQPQRRAKISVLVTGRKNSKYLAKFLHGLMVRTGDMANVEVLVMLNKEDTWNRELQAFYMALGLNVKGSFQFFEEDYKLGRDGLHKYFNDMAEFATGDWLVYFCDDHFITASGWDNAIRDFAEANNIDSSKINFIIPKFDNAGTMNHIVSRGAYTAMGQLGRHGWIDSYLNDVMHRMGHDERVFRMDDELFHDFTHDTPNPMSEEHQATIKNQVAIDELPKHQSPAYHQLAIDDANKLKDLIDREVL